MPCSRLRCMSCCASGGAKHGRLRPNPVNPMIANGDTKAPALYWVRVLVSRGEAFLAVVLQALRNARLVLPSDLSAVFSAFHCCRHSRLLMA